MTKIKDGDVVKFKDQRDAPRGYTGECVVECVLDAEEIDGETFPESAELIGSGGDYCGEVVPLADLERVQSYAEERDSRPPGEQIAREIHRALDLGAPSESGPVEGTTFPVYFRSESGHMVSAGVSIHEIEVQGKGGWMS